MELIFQVLAPCGVNDFVCGRASEWVHNGTELCHSAGFAVKDDLYLDMEETSCYGGKASLDLIAESWKASGSEVPQKVKSVALLKDFQQWASEMPFSERVSWAVGGMVLTAGLLFVRSDTYSYHFICQGSQHVILYQFADMFNRADFPINLIGLFFLFGSLLCMYTLINNAY